MTAEATGDVRTRLAATGSILDRWRLVFKVVPLVAAVAAAKLAVAGLAWDGLSLNPLYSGLVAATVFLLGFLLAGTLTDFKESERLPGEIAAAVEAIADECVILYGSKQAGPARACLDHLHELAASLSAWLHRRGPTLPVLERIAGLNRFFREFEPLTQPNFIVRLKQEQSALRRMVIRVHTIRETSFVGAGYAIAEVASALLVVTLLFVDIRPVGEAIVILSIITFLLAYMIFLIKDLDDPFHYANGRTGVAEVSLQAIDHVEERIARSTASLAAERPSL